MPITLRNYNVTWDSDTLSALIDTGIPTVASVSASAVTTTVQTTAVFPFDYKIRLVTIFVSAIDAVAGGDTINLVLANAVDGATSQSYNQNNAVPNDNSQTHSTANSIGADATGYPTNIGVAGQTVFANDIPFTSTNTVAANTAGVAGDLTGRAVPNTGWVQLAAGGGWGIFVPTNYDGVYPSAIPLGIRVSTVASTGSITNLRVKLGIVPFPRRKGPVPSSTTYTACVPATDY